MITNISVVVLCMSLFEQVPIMEFCLETLKIFAVGALVFFTVGAFMMKMLKILSNLEQHVQNIAWSSSAYADKLNFVERRMERTLQTGDETARHLCQVVMEYNAEMAGN